MSKSDIQTWIFSSSVGVDEDDVQQENMWRRVPTDWPVAMEYAQKVLLNEKTKTRIGFLRNNISVVVKHAG